jgi:gliding motility-associated-like protein
VVTFLKLTILTTYLTWFGGSNPNPIPMKTSLRISLVVIMLVSVSHSGFSQLFNFNPPTITGQRPTPLVTPKNTPITITFDHLRVTDPDILVPAYPEGYTLKVSGGDNYSLTDATVTPSTNFVGTLTVKVQVNDGKFDSNVFDLKIDVQNYQPEITGQDPLSMMRGESINVLLGHLKVSDDDNKYPDDFTLTIHDGTGYSVIGNTVTPNADFSGILKVLVTVNDGHDDSDKFELSIDVKKKNEPPVITGQDELKTNEDQPITIAFGDLNVVDPDNNYPTGFKMKILPGNNYQVTGRQIKPSPNYNGDLIAPVVVNDGIDDSNPYNLKIKVTAVNDRPVIDGQEDVQISAETPTPIEISSLEITDPDNQPLTLKILAGNGYSVSGQRTITTAAGVVGEIIVRVIVNDGIVDSAPYDLKVTVLPKSEKPVITGQRSLVIYEDENITLEFNDISVTDEDDDYPVGFTMVALPGKEYSYSGLTVAPNENFNGQLEVPIQVYDGDKNPSNTFTLKIYVLPANDAPRIVTMETETIPYEPGTGPISLTTTFESLDSDNEYLSFAEISIADSTFALSNDVLLFENTELIRGIYDRQKGILSLIGYATPAQYDSAIRTVKYNYLLTEDEHGAQAEVKPGSKVFLFSLSDGALGSEPRSRILSIETSVLLDIPNAFTPNGAANSDVNPNNTWAVRPLTSSNQFDKAIIKVYNKRGLLVYESKGFEKRWDGSFNGETLPVDTYYYTIDLKLTFTAKTYKGTVMILR